MFELCMFKCFSWTIVFKNSCYMCLCYICYIYGTCYILCDSVVNKSISLCVWFGTSSKSGGGGQTQHPDVVWLPGEK